MEVKEMHVKIADIDANVAQVSIAFNGIKAVLHDLVDEIDNLKSGLASPEPLNLKNNTHISAHGCYLIEWLLPPPYLLLCLLSSSLLFVEIFKHIVNLISQTIIKRITMS